ncbi:transposase family protein [Nocardia aobensis]|uniref:transposase family protein n=1 Tax=Nocardia aobensis TaxID=257277 RepID=UPI00056C6C0F|nr:transposase family protein [Nocardia aobensis]
MSLLEVLGEVTDPRARRGGRYSAHAILAAVLAAVVAGARSLTAIGQWVGEAPAAVLSELTFGASVPVESTIRRLLQAVATDALDAPAALVGGQAEDRCHSRGAENNGYNVSGRGRIQADIIKAYNKAS